MSDYPDWQTPQQHADRIAVTGVPLLRATTNLGNGAAQTLAGGAIVQMLPSKSVNQPGYEMTIRAYMPASSGTVPFLRAALLWWDSATGLFGNRRDIVIPCGNDSPNEITSFAYGPMHSDMWRVDLVNLDPAVTATYDFTANQTSHVFELDHAAQYQYAATAPNGFSNPMGVSTSNVIAYTAPTIGAGSSASVLCALYSGDAILNVNNSSGTNQLAVYLLDPAGYASGSANAVLFRAIVAAGTAPTFPVTLPYTPLVLKMTNNGTAGTETPSASLIGQEH